MKKINLLLVLVLGVLIVSCEKDEITVNLNQSGTVEIKVVDTDNKALPNANVTIGGSYIAFEGNTDNNGICKSEKLLQGSYICVTNATYGKATYTDSKYIQVIANENKKIELNPLSNSGNINITVVNYYNDKVVSNVNVALVPYRTNISQNSIENIKSVAYFLNTTDTNGKVSFPKVPAEVEYRVFVFDSNEIYSVSYYNTVYVTKGMTNDVKIEIYQY